MPLRQVAEPNDVLSYIAQFAVGVAADLPEHLPRVVLGLAVVAHEDADRHADAAARRQRLAQLLALVEAQVDLASDDRFKGLGQVLVVTFPHAANFTSVDAPRPPDREPRLDLPEPALPHAVHHRPGRGLAGVRRCAVSDVMLAVGPPLVELDLDVVLEPQHVADAATGVEQVRAFPHPRSVAPLTDGGAVYRPGMGYQLLGYAEVIVAVQWAADDPDQFGKFLKAIAAHGPQMQLMNGSQGGQSMNAMLPELIDNTCYVKVSGMATEIGDRIRDLKQMCDECFPRQR